MIISHTHRFIFLKSTKTAGTSIEAALSQHCSGDDVVTELGDYRHNRDESGNWVHRAMNAAGFDQEEPALSVRDKLGPRIWQEYFKFSIARNPWDRAVSSFSWHKRRSPKPRAGLLHKLGLAGDEIDALRPAFAEFVRDELKTNDRFYLIDGELCVDYVIRYEQLQQGYDEVCNRIGVASSTLPRLKSGIREGGRHYRDYFDAATRDLVAHRHAHDLRLFGYVFEER
ncbi:MAG: sulfotransferase family 2 domain-containing protein [Burkholderiales bacterium]|nr:sulfotransferase family 2 domain-containing protein [Burkholderiales bacterium]